MPADSSHDFCDQTFAYDEDWNVIWLNNWTKEGDASRFEIANMSGKIGWSINKEGMEGRKQCLKNSILIPPPTKYLLLLNRDDPFRSPYCIPKSRISAQTLEIAQRDVMSCFCLISFMPTVIDLELSVRTRPNAHFVRAVPKYFPIQRERESLNQLLLEERSWPIDHSEWKD